MPVARSRTFALTGLEAVPVTVEVDISPSENTSLVIVGLPDSAVKESKDRVLTALKNCKYPLQNVHCTVNLAPGHLRKEGSIYDLPIALCIVQAMGKLKTPQLLENLFIAGELSLNGDLRPISGSLPLALLAKRNNAGGILIPSSNSQEASAVPIAVYPCISLNEAISFLNGTQTITPAPPISLDSSFPPIPLVEFSSIRGQHSAKRALEITAAGGHNIVFSGPPGSGKSMLAKALIGIMPSLTLNEALETTQIYSVARLVTPGQSLLTQRPFRSPHHTISYAGLAGGGTSPRPGEISLAHNGVLFLDELPEFSRSVLEVLRQPLEDRVVTISRAKQQVSYPCRFICVAAMNPCPCGYRGHPTKGCKDTETQVQRYLGKISGPLWDRFDMHIEVPPVSYQEMHGESHCETSATVRARITQARKRQYQRNGPDKINSMLNRAELQKLCPLDTESRKVMQQAMEQMGVSARAADRILRVALTIADLSAEPLHAEHLMEALSYRSNV